MLVLQTLTLPLAHCPRRYTDLWLQTFDLVRHRLVDCVKQSVKESPKKPNETRLKWAATVNPSYPAMSISWTWQPGVRLSLYISFAAKLPTQAGRQAGAIMSSGPCCHYTLEAVLPCLPSRANQSTINRHRRSWYMWLTVQSLVCHPGACEWPAENVTSRSFSQIKTEKIMRPTAGAFFRGKPVSGAMCSEVAHGLRQGDTEWPWVWVLGSGGVQLRAIFL